VSFPIANLSILVRLSSNDAAVDHLLLLSARGAFPMRRFEVILSIGFVNE